MFPLSYITMGEIKEIKKILMLGLFIVVIVLAILNLPLIREEYSKYKQITKISAEKKMYFMSLYQAAGQKYDIPWELLKAINKVETDFGQNTGKYRVLDVLAKDQKDEFYQICSETGIDPSSVKGSKAGAIGFMQFLPETWQKYKDASGNPPYSPWDEEDSVFAAAKLLAENGGREEIYRAIWNYNPDPDYVDEVTRLAAAYSENSKRNTAPEDSEETVPSSDNDSPLYGDQPEAKKMVNLADRPNLKPHDIKINWWLDKQLEFGKVYESVDPDYQEFLLFSVLTIDALQNETAGKAKNNLDQLNYGLQRIL